MSDIYKALEKEVEEIESIENWSDKVSKMKEIKEKITDEKQKLGELINMVIKNEIKLENEGKKKKKTEKCTSKLPERILFPDSGIGFAYRLKRTSCRWLMLIK